MTTNAQGVILCPRCGKPQTKDHVCGMPSQQQDRENSEKFFKWLQAVLNDIDRRLKVLEKDTQWADNRVTKLEKRFNKVKAIVKELAKKAGVLLPGLDKE